MYAFDRDILVGSCRDVQVKALNEPWGSRPSPFASLAAVGKPVDPVRWPKLDVYVNGILGRSSMANVSD